ncbi:MAG TPA: NifB/NifX family molybdenum-iron cluster-binding protein [Gaiellaceae bacterium]|nr:NifB/NifX family molybdenum-iron cluster-binding protein [Gaiellaceae bacterium]
MLACVPVLPDGSVDPRWGRADRVAIAEVTTAGVESWQELDVGWGALRESGPEGSHHARIARFLREHGVEAVVANHMGAGMEHMLGKMGLAVRLGAAGPARTAALSALE